MKGVPPSAETNAHQPTIAHQPTMDSLPEGPEYTRAEAIMPKTGPDCGEKLC
jgi:hypothetical protein